jgi:cytochrome c-type biogenesis protein CcmF
VDVLGRACVILALVVAVYGIGASVYGAVTGRREWVASGRRAVFGLAILTTVAFGVLEIAFLRSDFSFRVVAEHSSTTTPTFYKVTAPWSSQEGSLLLWLWLLSLWSSLVLALTGRRLRQVTPWATAVLCVFASFFALLLVGFANPFEQLAAVPPEGAGLSPLLRHPSMMIHPPMLYSGYTLWAIPFAFAVGALITRRVDTEWIRMTRRFALAAWLFLGIGVLLGARWSYTELGWGGYWAWDPVENAALLPWLTGTAFLHSVMIQERRGMLKTWNASLILCTGVLAILGTFLVRSGILDSIHAFGASTLGVPFVVFIGLLVALSVGLVVTRRDTLRSEHKLDSLISREAIFLLNNLVLVGMAFVVFWGTFFPLISEAVTGQKASVGPPWFDRYVMPLALLLVLLAGIGPVIAWRKATARNLARNLLWPAVTGVVVALATLPLGTSGSLTAVAMFGLAAFVVATVVQELWRGTRARRAMTGESPPAAFTALVGRNRRRYGGYLVHVGIVVLFVGVAASTAFNGARDVRLAPGQSARLNGYDYTYVKPTTALAAEKITLGAVLDVSKDGRHVTTLRPSRGYYPASDVGQFGVVGRFFEGESTSEVGLRAGPTRDLWTAVSPDLTPLQPLIDEGDRRFARAGPQAQAIAVVALTARYERDPGPATFRIIVSPLVTWIWLGGLIVFGGGLLAMWPSGLRARSRVTAGAAARAARESGRARA